MSITVTFLYRARWLRAKWQAGSFFSVSTGLALGLSYPPYPFPFLAWMALVPLFISWRRSPSPTQALRSAYVSFLVMYAVAFYWPLCHVLPETAFISLSGLLIVPLMMSVPFALAVPFRKALGSTAGWFALVCCFLLMEGALQHGPFAFPWSLLGHTQSEALRFNQFAAWTGVPGLTLWVLLLNLACLPLIRAATPLARFRQLIGLTLLLALPLGAGLYLRASLPSAHDTLNVGFVQPAILAQHWADVMDEGRVDTLLRLSEPLLVEPWPDLLIWPETALPVRTSNTEKALLDNRLQGWVEQNHLSLLTGAIVAEAPSLPSARSDERGHYFNSAVLFSPGTPLRRYDKRRLVPFAERVPLLEHFPWLEALTVPAGGVAGYLPGGAPVAFQLGRHHIGVLICFESVFGNPTRPYVGRKPDLLVVLTQDGWWGRTPGYRQHFAFNRLRAIETRTPVLQVSVTGLSGLILPDGSSVMQTRWMERTARTIAVPTYNADTFYSRHGDWLTSLAALLISALTGLLLWVRIRAQ